MTMSCGNHERHTSHTWGRWDQHFCGGKRNPQFAFGGRPS